MKTVACNKYIIFGFLLVLCMGSSQRAEATNYYVKNGGNDNLDGMSDGNAWASLAKVSSMTFSAGDNIHLKSGGTWYESVSLKGNGTMATPIRLMAYGLGAKPHIRPQVQNSSCVLIDGYEGWEVIGLELSHAQNGVFLRYWEDLGNDYIWLHNLNIHDMDDTYNSNPYLYNHLSCGISVQSFTENTTLPAFLSNLFITDVNITDCWIGFWTGTCFEGCWPNGFTRGKHTYLSHFSFDNVKVKNAAQTGLSFIFTRYGTVDDCDVDNAGWGTFQYGTTGGLVAYSWNVIFDGCDMSNIKRGPQNYDGCGWDFEGITANITYKNAEIWNTEGCGIFVFDNGGTGVNTGLLIDNVRVTRFGTNPGNTSAGIHVMRGSTPHSGTVKNTRLNRSIIANPFRAGNYTDLTYTLVEYSDVLSTGKPTDASSYNGVAYAPSKATDWNMNTYWCANGGTMPQYLWVDLGATRAVTRIEQVFNNYSTWQFRLWGSTDGSQWTLIGDYTQGFSGSVFTHNGGGMFRWIMLDVVSGAGHWATSKEFTVFAY